jgi:hypothetical protein
VAPKKQLSVPRLELQASVLASRLAETILKEHKVRISKKFFWSDSQTALAWIHSDHRRYKQFVANRVSEILETTKIDEWHWIPGRLNVADIATKIQPGLDLTLEGPWFGGPEFLKLPENEWKMNEKMSVREDDNPNCLEERRAKKVCAISEKTQEFSIVDVERFSKWSKMIRVVGWVLRFIEVAKVEGDSKKKERRKLLGRPLSEIYGVVPTLKKMELVNAEKWVLKQAQSEMFLNEIALLIEKKPLPRGSFLSQLSPYLDAETGLIKMKGRIDATPHISDEFKRPIILSRNHPITQLLVRAYHERFYHQNAETVVNEIRQKFWIPQLRVAVKSCISNCQQCKNRRAIPQTPEESPLPFERLGIYEKPFTYTGVDFFGPLMVTVGRHHEKRYGVIFTCLTIRAVYIEIASSLDTDSCVMVVRNFMCRFGRPKVLWSDNGTNFHAADSELREELLKLDRKKLDEKTQSILPGDIKTEWKFNPPKSPHMGGAWERLIRSIKSVVYEVLKDKAPREEILRSFLIEAENVVNCRPLTYQPVDPDTHEAITPFHLLRRAGVVYPQGDFGEEEAIKKTWRNSQQLANSFWKRFVLEYLPDLTKRTKWYTDQRPIKEGDVVIICDEAGTRNCWEKGVVIELREGPDGKCRSATVRTARTTRLRPVSKLAILDV